MSVVWTEVKQTGTFLLPSSGATLLTVLAPKCPLQVMTVLGAVGFSSEASHGIAFFKSFLANPPLTAASIRRPCRGWSAGGFTLPVSQEGSSYHLTKEKAPPDFPR